MTLSNPLELAAAFVCRYHILCFRKEKKSSIEIPLRFTLETDALVCWSSLRDAMITCACFAASAGVISNHKALVCLLRNGFASALVVAVCCAGLSLAQHSSALAHLLRTLRWTCAAGDAALTALGCVFSSHLRYVLALSKLLGWYSGTSLKVIALSEGTLLLCWFRYSFASCSTSAARLSCSRPPQRSSAVYQLLCLLVGSVACCLLLQAFFQPSVLVVCVCVLHTQHGHRSVFFSVMWLIVLLPAAVHS